MRGTTGSVCGKFQRTGYKWQITVVAGTTGRCLDLGPELGHFYWDLKTFHLFQKGSKMAKTYKPGQQAPRSGQYGIVGPKGGDTGKKRTVTKGEPLPPTLKKGADVQVKRSHKTLTVSCAVPHLGWGWLVSIAHW